jgi:hypothetical protein
MVGGQKTHKLPYSLKLKTYLLCLLKTGKCPNFAEFIKNLEIAKIIIKQNYL